MLLEELDGFVAGLLVCPDLILPSEWMHRVVNGTGTGRTGFRRHRSRRPRSRSHQGALQQHRGRAFRNSRSIQAAAAADSHDNRIVWELWISGFQGAVGLRPESWQKLLDAAPETAAAIRGLFALVDAGCSDQILPEPEYAALDATAPGDIARWVITLNAWRLANYQPGRGIALRKRTASSKKISRNDRCPCGTGKKYKKCCGLN
jgi:uncharacterized protein